MIDNRNNFLDFISLLSFFLGYQNLTENEQQSEQQIKLLKNIDLQSENDKQATFLLNEIYKKFDEQNEKIDKILSLLEVKE